MPAHSLAVMPATLEITNGLVMGEGVAQRILQTNVVRRFIAAQFAGITIMEIQEGLDTRTAHRFAIPSEPTYLMSLAGQLAVLSVEVERADAEAVKRAEAEARYKAKVIENIAIHKASRQVQAERRVLAVLRKQPGSISTADLAHKLGQDRGSARYALMRLVERGKAANVGSLKRQLWIATIEEQT